MTRKHFKAIAEILKSSNANVEVVLNLAKYLATLNPKFDKSKFLKACK